MIESRKAFCDTIARFMLRDLEGMRREVERYPNDGAVWKAVPGLTNCGGTLVLHIAGNVQHYIGALFGKSGYVRNRDLEFVLRDVPRAELLRELDSAITAVTRTFSTLDTAAIDDVFPEHVQNLAVPTDVIFMHLATHLTYHLGQLDYHRRMVTGDAATVGTLSIPALLMPFPPMPS